MPHARAPYLEARGDRWVVGPRLGDALILPALLAFVAAPCALILGSLAAAWWADGDRGAFLAGWGVSAALAAPLAVGGLVALATAPGRVARARVTLDLAERLLLRPGASPEVLRGVRALRARRGAAPWSGLALELALADGRRVSLLRGARDGRALAEAARRLAHALGVEVDLPS